MDKMIFDELDHDLKNAILENQMAVSIALEAQLIRLFRKEFDIKPTSPPVVDKVRKLTRPPNHVA